MTSTRAFLASLIVALVFVSLAPAVAAGQAPPAAAAAEDIEPFATADLQDRQHHAAVGFGIPVRPVAATFDATTREHANFTSFSGGKLSDTPDGVSFTVGAGATAALGWGNADGSQPAAEQWRMPEELAHVVLRIRQTRPGETTLRMEYTRYGDDLKTRGGEPVAHTIRGTDWEELRFDQRGYYETYGAPADGLRFTFTNAGEQAQRYEIAWIRIEQPRREAYVRHEFELPEGRIIRALAEVSGMDRVRWYRRAVVKQELWINGQKVDRLGDLYYLRTGTADLSPYLKPGKNVIGMYGYGVLEPPMLFVQAAIMQPSGVTEVMTGEGEWTYSWDHEEGWSTVGFDGSSWPTIQARSASSAVETENMNAEPAEPYVWRGPDMAFPPYDGSLPIPGWLGLIQFYPAEGGHELSFREGRSAAVRAVVPHFITMDSPYVEYTLHETSEDGTNGRPVMARRIRTAEADKAAGTLAFTLPLGELPGGVYTLTARLINGDGEVLEARPREPVLVVSHIEQPAMAAADPYASLTLDETDRLRIDFTDPSAVQGKDWVETMQGEKPRDLSSEVTSWDQATIKTLNGQKYRETVGKTRGSMFSYRFAGAPDGPFKFTPGDYYLMELTYPDDAMRHMEVSISSTYLGLWNNSQSGVGVDTGEKYANTGQMQTLRWIHVADPGVHSVDIINAQETRHTTPEARHAAAQSLTITRIVPPLPATAIGSSREFGIDSERTAPNSGIGKNFGVERPDDDSGTLMERMVRTLRSNQEATDRYVQYMRFAGQNTHVIGMWQYHDSNTPYKRANHVGDGRLDPTLRNVLARTLDANGISFYAGLEISQLSNLNTAVTDAQVAIGTDGGSLPENDTVMMVDRDGKQFDANQVISYTQNWMHPAVQDGYRELIQNVASKFDDLENFRGIHFQMSWAQRSEYYLPGFSWRERADDPFVYSFDDVTFAKFRDDTGIDIAVGSSDPGRFAERHRAVSKGPHRAAFVQWRNAQLKEFLERCVAAMKQVDDSLVWANLLNIDETDYYRVWERWEKEHFDGKGNSFTVMLRDYGIDLPMLNAIDGMTVGRSAMGWREMPNSYDTGLSIFGQQNPYHWWARTDERIADAFDDDSDDLRYVLIRNSWDENVVVGEAGVSRGGSHFRNAGEHEFIGGDKDWVVPRRRIRAMPQPRGVHAREPFIQSIILSDPNLLLGAFIDLNINVGHEEDLLPLAQVFTKLPRERFERVLDTGLTTNFAISKLVRNGKTWFYVANPGYWPISGVVTIEATGPIRNVADGSVASDGDAGERKLGVTVEPYHLEAFVVDGDAEIRSFATAAISAADEAPMRKLIQEAAALLPASPATETERFVAAQLRAAEAALSEQRYAQAWSLLTQHRFWTWKFRAERPGIYITLPMWRD